MRKPKRETVAMLCGLVMTGALGFFMLGTLSMHGADTAMRNQDPVETSPMIFEGTAQVGQVFNLPPNPAAPFTAIVEFETTQTLSDRSVVIHKSSSNVARDSKGRTRNELRVQVDGPNGRQTQILEVVLYYPATGIRTTLSPRTHTARQTEVKLSVALKGDANSRSANTSSPGQSPGRGDMVADRRNTQIQEVGMDFMEGLAVKHFRERRMYPVGSAGNDREIETVFDYWYSPELKVNVLGKRIDPRAGTQRATLKGIRRGEPEASLFEIPADYRVIGPEKAAPGSH
jgi:hypothetical protein